jgi:hypothetical protein
MLRLLPATAVLPHAADPVCFCCSSCCCLDPAGVQHHAHSAAQALGGQVLPELGPAGQNQCDAAQNVMTAAHQLLLTIQLYYIILQET